MFVGLGNWTSCRFVRYRPCVLDLGWKLLSGPAGLPDAGRTRQNAGQAAFRGIGIGTQFERF
jgi:hypothetical protein